jgi:thioredoxin-dependent peroxiredoxin
MQIKINQIAPDFSLPDQEGKIHQLSDFKGKWVLLYFYPKDDTPGCTAEGCAFRDNLPDFNKLNVTVLGVSADTVKSHKKFAEKYGLSFFLLSDETKKTIKDYDVWGSKNFLGKMFEGILRTSFLINPEGIIVKIYENVKPKEHAQQVLADLNQLGVS